MKKENNALMGIAIIAYIIVGIVQFVAMIGGLSDWIGSTFIAILISFILGWIPIIGTIAGIYHSVNSWDWNIFASILFFCFPLVLAIIGGIGATIIEKIKKLDSNE
jgi:hypothetical protein